MRDAPHREDANVSAQGVVVGAMTVLSRISGLVRDIVLSHVLGAAGVADTFFLAFRIPNFFRRLFAEGAFAQAFVPVLAEYRQRGDEAALRAFVGVMAGNLGSALLGVTVLGVLGAWPLAALFMWGLMDEPERFALAVDLTRIVFPYLALVSLAAFVGAALNAANRYAAPAFTPVLLNVSLIAAALIGAASAAPGATVVAYALAWGVLAAGAAQLLFQLPVLARIGLLKVQVPNWRHPGAKKVGRLLVPAVFAASAGQVNALIGTMLAALLEEGSPSWLYYADRLMELPIGIVAVALGTVLLPNLSRLHSAGRQREYNATLDWGMRAGLLLGVPASAALGLLALPLVATIFLHGETVARDADMIAAALRAFAIGLVPLGAGENRRAGLSGATGCEDAGQVRGGGGGGERRRQPRHLRLAWPRWSGAGDEHCGFRQCRTADRRPPSRRPLPAEPTFGDQRGGDGSGDGGDVGSAVGGAAGGCVVDCRRPLAAHLGAGGPGGRGLRRLCRRRIRLRRAAKPSPARGLSLAGFL